MSELSSLINDNQAFILTFTGIIAACCAGFLTFILKSRCTSISCCGCKIERQVIPPEQLNQVQLQPSVPPASPTVPSAIISSPNHN